MKKCVVAFCTEFDRVCKQIASEEKTPHVTEIGLFFFLMNIVDHIHKSQSGRGNAPKSKTVWAKFCCSTPLRRTE